jgi:ribosomal protein S18 acetylase RimI-like enzyme/predicted nucleotidyltransferase
MMIYISEDDLQIINEILKRYPYSFYAYGSRVKDRGQKFSDLDLCVIDQTMPQSTLSELKEELEESNLSITVDIISWFDIQADFRCLIEKDLTLIQANPNFIKAENNQFSKCIYLPRSLGYSVIDNGFATIVNCGLDSTMFNSVSKIKFNDRVDEQIQDIIDQYNKKPFAWWLGSRDIPTDLGSRLEKYGFKKQGTEYAMFCKLDNFEPFELDKNITIKQVSTREEIEDFLVELSVYDNNIREFFNDKVISVEVMEKNPLFVSYIEGKPVSNGSLHLSNDIAGIYDIITAESLRGRGIGTNMMKYLMNFVHQKNYNKICLSTSSDSGFRIYSRLGFKVVGIYGCYERS